MKYILAIDQGTTGSRAIVFDRRGRAVASAYQEFKQYFPRPGWVEHDPEEIWLSVHNTIQEVLAGVPGSSIAAIGIANQRETTILWDRTTGRPVHPAIVWQCRRTAERCRQLNEENGMADFIRKRTGLPIDAYFSATKAEWILRQAGRDRAKRGDLCFGNPDAWLLWKLTGGVTHATDPTNASRTMLFNIETLRWDDELLKLFGVPEAILPEVRLSSGDFGRTIKIGRLPAGIPIAGIAGDQQAALFGQAGFEAGAIKATYGTGCFILMNTGRKRVESRHGLITTLACGPAGEVDFALEGSVFVAGAAVQWLRDQLGLLKISADSKEMAEAVEDTGGVYFVPAFVGLGAPYWDPDARGTITGLTRGTNKNHLVRAALEAMCYSTRDILETMKKDSGLSIGNLRVDGGPVANDFLCRFQADILGIPVLRPKAIETTAFGAATLAGLSVGFWKDAAEIERLWAVDRTFRPALKKSRAEDLYEGWLAAVKKTRAR
jgi:glycerol kinase